MIKFVRSGLVLLVVSVLMTGCATVGDWWSDSGGSTRKIELKEIEKPLSTIKVWSERVGSGSAEQALRLTAAFDGGRIFAAGREGEVIARDAGSGGALWSVNTKKSLSAGPGVGEGVVVVGTTDATVIALSSDDGSELWRSAMSSEILSLPVISSGNVVVRTADGAIVQLALKDGSRQWSYEHPVPVLSLRGVSTPVLAGEKVVAGFASGKMLALEMVGGGVAWVARLAVPKGRSELDRLVDLDGDLVLSDGVIYASAYQGNVSAVEQESGIVLWTRKLSSFSGLGADNVNVYVADVEGQVWALDRDTGAALWKQDSLQTRKLTAPVVHGDYIVLGDSDGYLHWISRDTGRLLARVKADSDGVSAVPVVNDSVLYVLGNSGLLSAYEVPSAP